MNSTQNNNTNIVNCFSNNDSTSNTNSHSPQPTRKIGARWPPVEEKETNKPAPTKRMLDYCTKSINT